MRAPMKRRTALQSLTLVPLVTALPTAALAEATPKRCLSDFKATWHTKFDKGVYEDEVIVWPAGQTTEDFEVSPQGGYRDVRVFTTTSRSRAGYQYTMASLFTMLTYWAEGEDITKLPSQPHPNQANYGPVPTCAAALGRLFQHCDFYIAEKHVAIFRSTDPPPDYTDPLGMPGGELLHKVKGSVAIVRHMGPRLTDQQVEDAAVDFLRRNLNSIL